MDIFPYLRMDGVEFGIADLTAPWAALIESSGRHFLYVVRNGSCLFEANGEALALRSGDILAVTNDVPHALRDRASTPVPRVPRALPVERLAPASKPHGGRRAAARDDGGTRLLVGWVPYDVGSLTRLLPTVIHIPAGQSPHGERIERLLRLIEAEISGDVAESGFASVVRRISEVIVVELVRFLETELRDGNPVWSRGLADPEVALVLARLHGEPGRAWTLRQLCSLAGLSRASLEARFRRLLSVSPKRYLVKLRMERAARELELGRRSIAQIAESLGYGSVASFHRAFKRELALTPVAYRRRAARRASRAAPARRNEKPSRRGGF